MCLEIAWFSFCLVDKHGRPFMGVKFFDFHKWSTCWLAKQKENHAISRQICVDHCCFKSSIHATFENIFPTNMHFITNGFKRFLFTNSNDLRQRVPLIFGLRTSSDQHLKTFGRIEPFLTWDGLLVLTRDRIDPFVKSAARLITQT